jgi:hypothetical protein
MLQFQDETVEVGIKRPDGEVRPVKLDVLELRLLCQELERKHSLKREGLKVFATRDFLNDFKSQLATMGIEASVNVAYQIWARAQEITDQLKKNTDSTQPSPSSTESTPTNSQPAS